MEEEEKGFVRKAFVIAALLVVSVLIFGVVSTADARGVEREGREARQERHERHERVRTHLETLFERFEKRKEERLEVLCKQFIDEDDDSSGEDDSEGEDGEGSGEDGSQPDPQPEPEPQPDPEPEPVGEAKLLITEVLYDLKNDGSQGSETGGDNEWVELHNAGDAAIDLAGFVLGETFEGGDILSENALVLEPGAFLVVTDNETTANFWDFSVISVVYLGSSISGGLSNSGDVVKIFSAGGDEIDAVSYGNNTEAFSPAVSGVTHGSSIERMPQDTDTNTAADWGENTTPTPGA